MNEKNRPPSYLQAEQDRFKWTVMTTNVNELSEKDATKSKQLVSEVVRLEDDC